MNTFPLTLSNYFTDFGVCCCSEALDVEDRDKAFNWTVGISLLTGGAFFLILLIIFAISKCCGLSLVDRSVAVRVDMADEGARPWLVNIRVMRDSKVIDIHKRSSPLEGVLNLFYYRGQNDNLPMLMPISQLNPNQVLQNKLVAMPFSDLVKLVSDKIFPGQDRESNLFNELFSIFRRFDHGDTPSIEEIRVFRGNWIACNMEEKLGEVRRNFAHDGFVMVHLDNCDQFNNILIRELNEN